MDWRDSFIEKLAQRQSRLNYYKLIASQLVNQFGFIPSMAWLKKQGLIGFYQYVINHPQEFAEFPRQENQRLKNTQDKTKEYHELAQALVEEHGYLPTNGWLQMNGYNALAQHIYKHPDIYRGFPAQISRTESITKDYIDMAQKLVAEHGAMPRGTWLIENGFGGLVSYMRKYPEKFPTFEKVDKKLHISLEEQEAVKNRHMQTAQELVNQHGYFPSDYWLQKQGFYALLRYKYRFPAYFENFPRRDKEKEHLEAGEIRR